MNPIAIRLLSQQLVAPQFSDPAEVVSYMGAMQAQEYRMMRWAVAMRTRRPSAKAFKRAFDNGRIIRLHLMRGTWQLVSAEEYWMMIGLCAPKAIAVTKGWMSSNKISIPDEELMRVRDILARRAADLGSATKEDLVRALAEKDIRMDDHRLSYHIRMAEMSGTLCSGELLPMKATYALAADKVKPMAKMDKDEALIRFTRKYFQSRQPHAEKWQGREFYLTDDCRTRGFRKGKFLLIPPYDEYLISYKSRDIVLPPEHRHHAHNNSGIFQPVIAYDGTICGNWSPFKDDCQATSFEDASNPLDISEAWQAYKDYREK